MLCSNNSSIHSPGTRASRAAASRALSSGGFPRATAAATRTNAAVWASSAEAVPSLILLVSPASSPILSLLQSSIYPQLPHRLAAGIHVGSSGERGRTGPETQRFERSGHGKRRGHCVSIDDFERDAEPLLREQGAIHALGTDLGNHAAGVRSHHLGTGPALTGDEIGVADHRFDNAECGIPQPCVCERHVLQRHPIAHHPTPIHRRL